MEGSAFTASVRAAHHPWASSSHMIRDVFLVLQNHRWARDYVLDRNRDPAQDALTLASPVLTQQALTRVLLCDREFGAHQVQMLIPVYSHNDVGVGVVAENNIRGVPHIFAAKLRTSRFVADRKSASTLIIYDSPDSAILEVAFLISGKCHVFLYFDRDTFLRAILTPCDIDFGLLHNALVHSCCGNVEKQIRPSLPVSYGSYPFAIPDIPGSYICSMSVCIYSNSLPIMAFTLGGVAHRCFNENREMLEGLKRWGISERLKNKPVAIAPAYELQPQKQLSKLERRQIQNRESAARSYARKRKRNLAESNRGNINKEII